jgi:predicted ATP-dependent protease
VVDGNETIGSVKAVFACGHEPDAKAVTSNVLARRNNTKSRRRVRFAGTAQFSNATKKHIRDTVVPLVDRILSDLQMPNCDFQLSVLNLGAALALDVGLSISGLSADAAVFVALLSAVLQIPVTDDFVATGHIASADGHIRAVKCLAAKV